MVNSPLETLSTRELTARAKDEIHSSRHGEEGGDDRYCLELLRRVAKTPEADAWSSLYELFSSLVCSWLLQKVRGREAIAIEGTADSLVAAIFEKLWLTLRTGTKRFLSVGAFLSYLKACVGSVLADWWRAYSSASRTRAIEIRSEGKSDSSEVASLLDSWGKNPTATNDPAAEVIAGISYQEIVQVVQDELCGEDEQVVGSLSLFSGCSPAEILRERPDLFTSVEQIYRIKRNVMERLRRRLLPSLPALVTRTKPRDEHPPVQEPEDDTRRWAVAHAAMLVVIKHRIRSLVEQTESFTSNGIRYSKRKAFCRKARCRKCLEGIGHGPYWYAAKTIHGRTVSTYLGKDLVIVYWNGERPSFHRENKPTPVRPVQSRTSVPNLYCRLVFCGKPTCRTCRDGIGHGPYWYGNTKNTNGRWVRTYLGRVLPLSHQSNARGESGDTKKKRTKQ